MISFCWPAKVTSVRFISERGYTDVSEERRAMSPSDSSKSKTPFRSSSKCDRLRLVVVKAAPDCVTHLSATCAPLLP
eukprot:CAMPEP_0194436660 /NCGR_PEP_ID=MMETSP0176-20130528/95902_1 /TAXON_ID=216777 /ORGANISM="Proboscia alata, Strain PI-D3" /LENGTH=76 /DNA_ID=CAMNT_0039257259 /DNA_START=192 /DNA_END=422 /DNA_ORIENTATION=-